MNLGMLLDMVADAAGDRLVVGSRRDGRPTSYRSPPAVSRR